MCIRSQPSFEYFCSILVHFCHQDRKKCFPPRPRKNRRKNQPKIQLVKDHVKLDTLRNCLSGLSQDSGVGSSQECPSLGLDQIVVPEYLQSSGKWLKILLYFIRNKRLSIGTSKSEDIQSNSLLPPLVEEIDPDSTQSKLLNCKGSTLRRKRQSSESSLSDFEVKKPKFAPKLDHPTSDLGSEVSSVSSFSTITSFSSETSGFHSEKSSGSISLDTSNSFGSEKSESDLCMFCNSAPKDSIFVHTNIAHRCCCYPCAKKTLKTIKRCPICNGSVNKVLRIFTS